MSFILQMVLIILLNETFAYITQDIERILLPALNSTSEEKILLTLKTFGKQIQLNLRRNQIVSSKYKVRKHSAKGITKKLSQSNASNPCYYFHKDHISTAIINCCQEHGWEGLVFLKDETLEIRPLRDDFASMFSIDDFCVKGEANISFGKPHLIKRSIQLSADSTFRKLNNFKLNRRHVRSTRRKLTTERRVRSVQRRLTIELAVFFDEEAYFVFMPLLKDQEKLQMMILAYVNNIQAIFHHPSLGVPIDISLVYLEIMREQPLDLSHFGGGVNLLDSFCSYAEVRNPADDYDPHHWDVALYLTAFNLYSKDSSTTGRSRGNVCNLNQSCVIVEFGTPNDVTSGFTSSAVAAREIGHVLGMPDDSRDNACDKNKYIMSPYKSNFGQITWSYCSRHIAESLWYAKQCLRDRQKNLEEYDHSQYQNLPGREWTAKAQCEIFFKNKDANVVAYLNICKTLECEDSNWHFFTGAALEGTRCGLMKECRGGECVSFLQPPLEYCDEDNWSEWEKSSCQSSCLEDSRGVRIKRRSCVHEIRRTASCDGAYYEVTLCDDSTICNESRTTIYNFSFMKCNKLKDFLKDEFEIELTPEVGIQVSHRFEEPWRACTIHCPRRNPSFYYAPRSELLSFSIDPYFPDGTWCHEHDGENFYCRHHECLPGHFEE